VWGFSMPDNDCTVVYTYIFNTYRFRRLFFYFFDSHDQHQHQHATHSVLAKACQGQGPNVEAAPDPSLPLPPLVGGRTETAMATYGPMVICVCVE